MDPTIRAQLNKVKIVADPEIEAAFPERQRSVVRIITTDGRELCKSLDFPKGDPRNPLSDRELEDKFHALAAPLLSVGARNKLLDAISNLEEEASVTGLLGIMTKDQ